MVVYDGLSLVDDSGRGTSQGREKKENLFGGDPVGPWWCRRDEHKIVPCP